MRQVFISLAAVVALTASVEAAPVDTKLNVSGDMTPNADGTASFEFRVANDRADIIVKGFTVTVAFYDRTVSPNHKLAEYNWSFVSDVQPNDALLEYGVLDAKAVAEFWRTVLKTGFMFRRPARNSASYVGSIEIPCESTPRRSVSTIICAVVSACASDMPQARNTLASCSWICFEGTRMVSLRNS